MGRRADRHTVESGLSMSVYQLIRYAQVEPGQDGGGGIRWVNSRTKQETASVAFRVAMSDPETAHVRLIYRADGRPVDDRIALERTPCPFGGWRWWFTCPMTGRRTGKLYVGRGGSRFACRQAHRLAYQSSRNGDLQRSRDKLSRMYARLGAAYEYLGEVPLRPSGMHRATYERMVWAIEVADLMLSDLCIADGERFLRRLR